MSETKLVVCKICGNLPIAGVRRYSLWCRNGSPKHHVEAIGDTREEVIATWNRLNDSALLEAAEEMVAYAERGTEQSYAQSRELYHMPYKNSKPP